MGGGFRRLVLRAEEGHLTGLRIGRNFCGWPPRWDAPSG
jgi:hypothetical protein